MRHGTCHSKFLWLASQATLLPFLPRRSRPGYLPPGGQRFERGYEPQWHFQIRRSTQGRYVPCLFPDWLPTRPCAKCRTEVLLCGQWQCPWCEYNPGYMYHLAYHNQRQKSIVAFAFPSQAAHFYDNEILGYQAQSYRGKSSKKEWWYVAASKNCPDTGRRGPSTISLKNLCWVSCLLSLLLSQIEKGAEKRRKRVESP